MKRTGSQRLHQTFVVLFMLCAALGLFSLYLDARASATALLGAGWGSYINAPENSKLAFSVSCLINGACRPVFRERFVDVELSLLTLGLGVGFAVFMLAALTVNWFASTQPDEKDPGGGHFATDKNLKAYLTDSQDPDNPRKGHYGYTESGKQLRAPSQDRCTHLAIFAGTGGGKTTRIIKPSLIQDALDGTSVLMVDPKWPDPRGGYSDMLAVFAAKGYDVQVFCPFEENTLGLPLIGSLQSHADAEALASTIIPKVSAGEMSDGAQFYRNQERELLKHLLWGEAQAGRGSMGGIYDLLDGGPKALTAWVAACEDPRIIRSMGTLLQLRHDTLIGLLQGLKGILSIFTNAQLDAATQAGPFAWQNLRPASLTERKSVLYVGIPQQMFLRGDGKLLLNLFFRRIMDEVMGIARQQGGTLERQLAVYIDEFANIGKLDDAGSWFGTMRSYNIAFTIAMQNRAQLELIYGTVGAKAMSGGNFQHLITFPASLTGDDKEYISKLLGEVTAEEVTESRSRQHLFEPFRRTKTRRRVARPLLSREEMNNWDANYGILVPHGAGPTKIVAPRIDQKRVGRVNNHFYIFRNTVGVGDSTVLVQGLLNRHKLMMRTPMPRRLEEPQIPKTDNPTDFVFTEPQGQAPQGVEAKEALVTVAEEPTPVPGRAQVVKVEGAAHTARLEVTKPSKTKKLSKTKPTVKKPSVKVEPLHHVPSGELMPSFRTWVDSLSWREVPITVFRVREGGQDRVSKILFEQLPGALRHEHLAHWKQRNWIRVHRGKLGIVNTGCVVLCRKQLDTFMASPQAQIVEIGEGSERVVVKARAESQTLDSGVRTGTQIRKEPMSTPDTAGTPPQSSPTGPMSTDNPAVQAALRAWIEQDGYRLDGHPSHVCWRQQLPRKALLGRYIPELFHVYESYLEDLEGLPSQAVMRFPRTMQRVGTESVPTRTIPGELLRRILPLRKLLTEDSALLEDYSTRVVVGKAVGKHQWAEIQGQKPILREVTGISLEHLEEKVLKIGQPRQSMRLLSIRVQPEPLTARSSGHVSRIK